MAINQAHVHPHYTLPGVMHYLQTEFTKNERDRITWELERSEMKARIAELEGENRDLKHQLNQIQSKAVSPEGEKEEKHVPDSLLQSKLAVQENVKEIIYLLKGPNTVNQLESLNSREAGSELHDLEKLNVNTPKEEGSAKTNGMDILNNALLDTKPNPKQGPSESPSPTKVKSLFSTANKRENNETISKIHSELSKVDIISSYGDCMSLYDADTKSLEIHQVDANLNSKLLKKISLGQDSDIMKFFWVSTSKLLVIEKSFHLKLFSISSASLISDVDLLQDSEQPFSSSDIINIDFKNKWLLIASKNKSQIRIWELDNIEAPEDVPINIKETYEITHDNDDDDSNDSTNILDCILGITEKSLILLSSNPYQLTIYDFEGKLLQKIDLKIDTILSGKPEEEGYHLFLDRKTSKLLIQLSNERLLVYSFDKKKVVLKEQLTPSSTLPIQLDLNDSIIAVSYSNGDFEFRNLENLKPSIDEFVVADINFSERKEPVVFSSNLIVDSTPVLITVNKNNEVLLHKIKI